MSFYNSNNNGATSNEGGGFFSPGNQTDAAGGSSTSPFPGSQTKSGGRKDRETLVPVMIRQLHQAVQDTNDDAMFMLGSAAVAQVRLVGCIVEMKEQSTSLVYIVEDGTGRVEVKLWLEQDDNEELASTRAKCCEGTYIRVIGNIKEFNGKRHISAFNVRPVEDFNELTHHALEAIFVHMRSEKESSDTKTAGDGAAPMATGHTAQQSSAGQGHNNEDDGMSSINKAVLQVFNNASSDEHGLDRRKAIEMLIPKGFDAQAIRKSIGFLVDEGHLYSTIDEDHLKSTDG